MSKSKKTVNVELLLAKANEALAHKDNSVEFKSGVAFMIETVLHKANCYRGFMYLNIPTTGEPPRYDSPEYFNRRYF